MGSAAYAKGNLRRSVRVAVLMGSFECFFTAAVADEQTFWFRQLVVRFYRNSKAFMRIWNSVKHENRNVSLQFPRLVVFLTEWLDFHGGVHDECSVRVNVNVQRTMFSTGYRQQSIRLTAEEACWAHNLFHIYVRFVSVIS
ncbi:toxin-antitoxin system, toxin component, RelE family [Trichinella spiralis]|uniref:toxin-antitoxin system, toxin component, RelE family n=1 Tax=Trichinella spiralis TaxID=6334 RepID=UPI0001EFE6AB|nr:toxin-antitoxin system, toxin component, RelE family [Trichinella spiralis]